MDIKFNIKWMKESEKIERYKNTSKFFKNHLKLIAL